MKNLIVAIAVIFSLTVMAGTENKVKPGKGIPVSEKSALGTYKYKEALKMSNLPKDVRQFLKENYPLRQVKEVSKVRGDGDAAYEVGILLDGKMSVIQFDKKGEFIIE